MSQTHPTPHHLTHRWTRRIWWLSLPTVAALALLWQAQRGEARSDPPPTQIVQRMTLEGRITALGTLQAMQAVEVGTQVSGQLDKLHVQVGDLVKAQQLLAEIDPSVLQSRVAAGQAGLRQLRAQLHDLQAKAELATLQLKRNRTLLAHEAVTEDAVQISSATQSSALAQVEAIKAQIDQAQAQLAGEEASLRTTRIHAPMGGTVVAVNVRAGQTVVASQTAPVLLRIANLQRMTVWAQVSEADVPAVVVGMPAEFSTLGLPERRWQGNVRQILPTPETVNNVVLYNVLFDVDNHDGALKPQMSAQVSFIRARVENALVVPLQALARKPAPGKDHQVQVLTAAGTAEARSVRIGLQSGGWAEVLAGLNDGETLVLDDPADKPGKKGSGSRPSAAATTGQARLF